MSEYNISMLNVRVFLSIEADGELLGKVVIHLRYDVVPRSVPATLIFSKPTFLNYLEHVKTFCVCARVNRG